MRSLNNIAIISIFVGLSLNAAASSSKNWGAGSAMRARNVATWDDGPLFAFKEEITLKKVQDRLDPFYGPVYGGLSPAERTAALQECMYSIYNDPAKRLEVMWLVAHEADPNVGHDLLLPLKKTLTMDDVSLAEFLCSQGADPNKTIQDFGQQQPLFFCCKSVAMAQLLVKHKVDFGAAVSPQSFLHCIVRPLTSYYDFPLIPWIVERYPHLVHQINDFGFTPLMSLAMSAHYICDQAQIKRFEENLTTLLNAGAKTDLVMPETGGFPGMTAAGLLRHFADVKNRSIFATWASTIEAHAAVHPQPSCSTDTVDAAVYNGPAVGSSTQVYPSSSSTRDRYEQGWQL
jgi:hypothetical protein